MNIPNVAHPSWEKLIRGEIHPNINFLATKILLNRLMINLQHDSSPDAINRSIQELIFVFESNIKIPKVQRDLETIFGKETVL